MALAQLMAFLNDLPEPEEQITLTGPDDFELRESSDLKAEHEFISYFLTDLIDVGQLHLDEPTLPSSIEKAEAYKRGIPKLRSFFTNSATQNSQNYLAILERVFAYQKRIHERAYSPSNHYLFFLVGPAYEIMVTLMDAGTNFDTIALPTFQWISSFFTFTGELEALVMRLLKQTQDKFPPGELPDAYRIAITNLRSNIFGSQFQRPALVETIDEILGDGAWKLIAAGEHWSDRVINDVDSMDSKSRMNWCALFQHCLTIGASRPKAKWFTETGRLLGAIGNDQLETCLLRWFNLVTDGRSRHCLGFEVAAPNCKLLIQRHNLELLRGLVFSCVHLQSEEICSALGNLSLVGYQRLPGLGPRAIKVGNAGVFVLGEIGNPAAVAQLSIIKARCKYRAAQFGIEQSLYVAAIKSGLPPEEIEEIVVPSYGLSDPGIRIEELNAFRVEIEINCSKAEIRWFDSSNKQIKEPRNESKHEFASELRELKQAKSDIEKMLSVQTARIERLYVGKNSWNYATWKERYLDHPLVGTIARRLIWRFTNRQGQQFSAIFHNGRFVDLDDAPADMAEPSEVSLWHPVIAEMSETLGWREWLFTKQMKQPFKQAHREVYRLTDAERATRNYSNRFDGLYVSQSQFHALCRARGWKSSLLPWNGSAPDPSFEIPFISLRVVLEVQGVGLYSTNAADGNSLFYYLQTHRTLFKNMNLEDVPEIIFSEVMRDIDLFVSVASVALDPAWLSHNPQIQFRDFVDDLPFGPLADSRKEMLQRIVPMLKVADRCSFSERHLIVRGDLCTYKIHIGTANIFMLPDELFLCIHGTETRGPANFFLPFEGDAVLSEIVSKVLLLANDKKIKDETIMSQIRRDQLANFQE